MTTTLTEAVRELRNLRKETQKEFADLLNIAVYTENRYEAGNTPETSIIVQLYFLAKEAGREDLANIFVRGDEATAAIQAQERAIAKEGRLRTYFPTMIDLLRRISTGVLRVQATFLSLAVSDRESLAELASQAIVAQGHSQHAEEDFLDYAKLKANNAASLKALELEKLSNCRDILAIAKLSLTKLCMNDGESLSSAHRAELITIIQKLMEGEDLIQEFRRSL